MGGQQAGKRGRGLIRHSRHGDMASLGQRGGFWTQTCDQHTLSLSETVTLVSLC